MAPDGCWLREILPAGRRLSEAILRPCTDKGVKQNIPPQTSQHMEDLIINNKPQYLNNNYPFEDAPKLTAQVGCIHCDCIVTFTGS